MQKRCCDLHKWVPKSKHISCHLFLFIATPFPTNHWCISTKVKGLYFSKMIRNYSLFTGNANTRSWSRILRSQLKPGQNGEICFFFLKSSKYLREELDDMSISCVRSETNPTWIHYFSFFFLQEMEKLVPWEFISSQFRI